MQRTFKIYTIGAGGTPQPLLGSFLTAAVAASSGDDDSVVLPVNDITPFQQQGWNAAYVLIQQNDGTKPERRKVIKVDVAGKKITIMGLTTARVAGGAGTASWVSLAGNVHNIYVQTVDGNVGPIYLGTGPAMVKATGAQVITKLVQVAAGVQPIDTLIFRHGAVDCEDPSNIWIDGTTGDSYLPSLGII